MNQAPLVRTVQKDAVVERVNGSITRIMEAPPPGAQLDEGVCATDEAVYQRVPPPPTGGAWALGVVTVGPRDLVMHGVFDEPDEASRYAQGIGGELRLVLVRQTPGPDGRVPFGDHPHNPRR